MPWMGNLFSLGRVNISIIVATLLLSNAVSAHGEEGKSSQQQTPAPLPPPALFGNTLLQGDVWDLDKKKAVPCASIKVSNDVGFDGILASRASCKNGKFCIALSNFNPKIYVRVSHCCYNCPDKPYTVTTNPFIIGRISIIPKEPNWDRVITNFIELDQYSGCTYRDSICHFWTYIESVKFEDGAATLKVVAASLAIRFEAQLLPDSQSFIAALEKQHGESIPVKSDLIKVEKVTLILPP